ATVMLLLYARRRPEIRPFRPRRADLPWLIVSGLCGYGVYQIIYIEGLARSTAFASALFSSTTSLWSAVLLASLRIERIWRWQWVGILLSLGGVLWFLTSAPPNLAHVAVDRGLTTADIALGNTLLFVGSGLFAIYGIVNKRLIQRYSAPELMAYTLLVGVIALAPFGIASLATQDWSHVTWRLWVIILYSVIFPIYLTYSIWNWAIGQRGVGYVTLYSYATPVLGGVVAYLALGEELSRAQIVAGGVVLAGMLLARWAIVRHTRAETRNAGLALTGVPGEPEAGSGRATAASEPLIPPRR
ncbi:MAG: DMT family transporter, partial [Chloroflexota bacterium]|nr:DMT family transporter [Chloroflexota bacterium]